MSDIEIRAYDLDRDVTRDSDLNLYGIEVGEDRTTWAWPDGEEMAPTALLQGIMEGLRIAGKTSVIVGGEYRVRRALDQIEVTMPDGGVQSFPSWSMVEDFLRVQ